MVGLTFALLACFGAQRVINGQGDLGQFFSYQWYLWGIIWPVRFMGWLISMMRQALAAAPRLFEILDAPLTIASKPDAIRPARRYAARSTFRDVRFAFDDEPERLVMKGLDLHVRPGEIVASYGWYGQREIVAGQPDRPFPGSHRRAGVD